MTELDLGNLLTVEGGIIAFLDVIQSGIESDRYDEYMRKLNDLAGEEGTDLVRTVFRALINTQGNNEERYVIVASVWSELSDFSLTALRLAGRLEELHLVRKSINRKIEVLINLVGEVAQSYPVVSKHVRLLFKKEIMDLLDQERASDQERIIAMYTGLEIIKPYVINRLLGIDLTDSEQIQEEIEKMKREIVVFLNFVKAIKNALSLAINKKAPVSHEELAEDLAKIGPLFIKLVQTFAEHYPTEDESIQNFTVDLVRIFQNGVAPMSAEEVKGAVEASYTEGVPRELILDYNRSLGSASIAQVNAGKVVNHGEQFESAVACKIRRPGVQRAFEDNVFLY